MIQHWLAGLLKPLGDVIFSWVLAVPMGAVRVIFVGVLAVIALWVITLPAQYPEGGEKRKRDDLRFFALGVLAIQALMYVIF